MATKLGDEYIYTGHFSWSLSRPTGNPLYEHWHKHAAAGKLEGEGADLACCKPSISPHTYKGL